MQGDSGSIAAAGVLGKNTGSGPGLSAIVSSNSVAPLKVNSSAKVANLNADQLDNHDSTYFLPTTGTAANSSLLGGKAPSAYWLLGGNAPGATGVLGTTDNNALELDVNGARALRLEPDATSPNVLAGFSGNGDPSGSGAHGMSIGGGGTSGYPNSVTDNFGTVGGGAGNSAGVPDADPTDGELATVAGGFRNAANQSHTTIGGGEFNTASATESTIAGGYGNTTSGNYSTIGGGLDNTASLGTAVVAGGYNNTASGTFSAIPGGELNTASGNHSFAAGFHAKATLNGSFVWGDNTATDLTSVGTNTFNVRAAGGIWLGTTSSPTAPEGSSHFIDTSTGGYLTDTGVWTDNSDRGLKHDFHPLNKQSVLHKVARMPITSWSYKKESSQVRHIGPMAQDFYSAFRLGLDNKHITTIDEGGVALAAIQGLYRQNQTLKARLARQDARLTRLERVLIKKSH